jgi:hypothetical protein
LVEILEREQLKGSPERAPDPLAIDGNQNPNLRHSHRVPAVPFYFRGTLMEPDDITRFNDRPLHFAIVGEETETRLVAHERHRDVMQLAWHQSVLATVRSEIVAPSVAADVHESTFGVTYGGTNTTSAGDIIFPRPLVSLFAAPVVHRGPPVRLNSSAALFSRATGADWALVDSGVI